MTEKPVEPTTGKRVVMDNTVTHSGPDALWYPPIEQRLEWPGDKFDRFRRALLAIRDMPIPEQDNIISANMRQIAREALQS